MRGRHFFPAAFVACAFLTAAPVLAESGSADASFDLGMRLYESGDADGAATAFAECLRAGAEHSSVHYNLGNARFKQGDLGRAIFHYRRALALAPRDEDVTANLEYARSLALDAVAEGDPHTDRRVEQWIDRVTPTEVARWAAFLWILGGIAGTIWQLGGRRARGGHRWTVAFLVLWGVCSAASGLLAQRAAGSREAVLLAREAEVRAGPAETFATAFVLHEGAEVVVEGERGMWTEISLPGDLRGWIPSAELSRL
ncbi:MAG: tetratricopeptide repeat protein [Gemmatimonadota bacterium]|jgi:tetratricopeptide (TPR) repeat protein|nr:hypothetical protein [Gemmatimonadota bacterium]MDP6530200.1 tetratricopeptide repeat protein [Gemmatimonadota bacterium]MDP6801596.1 tetratricopeptide repeat protein [Gemmatimonadota bacterium]MDP7030857.1 tetratricopeptide repeat protein [Gemmatimonadota bacterium]